MTKKKPGSKYPRTPAVLRQRRENAAKKLFFKHGAKSFLTHGTIPCDRCVARDDCPHFEEGASCKPIAEFKEKAINYLANLPYVTQDNVYLVEQLVEQLALQRIIHMWLAREGVVYKKDGALHVQPVIKDYLARSWDAVLRHAKELGLTPTAMKSMGLLDAENPQSLSDYLDIGGDEEDA